MAPFLRDALDQLDDSAKRWIVLLVVLPLFIFSLWYKWQQSRARRLEIKNLTNDESRARSARARVLRIVAGVGLLLFALLCVISASSVTPEGRGFLGLGALLGFAIGTILLGAECIRWFWRD